MKRIILSFIVFLLMLEISPAQPRFPEGRRYMHNRLRELEKVKLIEVLKMDEETSVRFFSRRTEFQTREFNIIDKRDSLIEDLKNIIDSEKADDKTYQEKFSEILKIDKQMMKLRDDFFKSLDDILTPEQKAKTIVFEHLFRKEVMDEFRKRKFRE